MDKEIKYMPSMFGNYTAYVPEYFDGKDWQRIPVQTDRKGIPQPNDFGSLNEMLSLYGYEQACALAWGYKAYCKGEFLMKSPKIRIQGYEVIYELKSKKISVEDL